MTVGTHYFDTLSREIDILYRIPHQIQHREAVMQGQNLANMTTEDHIDAAIRQLKAAKSLRGAAGATIHLLYARTAINQSINDVTVRAHVSSEPIENETGSSHQIP